HGNATLADTQHQRWPGRHNVAAGVHLQLRNGDSAADCRHVREPLVVEMDGAERQTETFGERQDLTVVPLVRAEKHRHGGATQCRHRLPSYSGGTMRSMPMSNINVSSGTH